MATRDPVGLSSTGLPSRPSITKATFFCPDCPHRSRFDGDWTIVRTDDSIRYLCPDCDAEVTVRPTAFDGVDSTTENATTTDP